MRDLIIALMCMTVVIAGCVNKPAPVAKEDGSTDVDRDTDGLLSLETANRFHLAALWRMIYKRPENVEYELRYLGILAHDTGRYRSGLRIHGNIGAPYAWDVTEPDGTPIFTIQVTNSGGGEAGVECMAGGERLHVSVTFIQGVETVTVEELNRKREVIGGRSVHELLLLLEGPEDDMEMD